MDVAGKTVKKEVLYSMDGHRIVCKQTAKLLGVVLSRTVRNRTKPYSGWIVLQIVRCVVYESKTAAAAGLYYYIRIQDLLQKSAI